MITETAANPIYRRYERIAHYAGWAAVIAWALVLRPGVWHLVFAALWAVAWSVSSFCRGRIRP